MLVTQLRLLTCPNGQEINMQNALTEHRQMIDDDHFTASTVTLVSAMDGSPEPQVLKNLLDAEAISTSDNSLDKTVRKVAGIACSKCLGPVTDRITGETFCGKYVPVETAKRNAMFEIS